MRLLAVGLALLAGCAASRNASIANDAASRFEAARQSPLQLRAFLYRMPKGADLHSHLSGAVYAETLVRAGADGGICVNPAKLERASCGPGARRLADALTDAKFHRALVDAWSMRSFVPTSGDSGHDHFFDTFEKFGGAADTGTMAADVVDRAGRQRMRYLELMITFQGRAVSSLARSLPWSGDMADYRARLMAAGLASLLAKAHSDIEAGEARMRALMQCDTPTPSPGCDVTVRWLQQVGRTSPPNVVFAQMLFAALLTQAEPHVLGLNFVAPEDDTVALADYTLQMRMLDNLHAIMPDANVALHAGELTLGLVPPKDLLFHVREAVELGHAKRIGHGSDIMYETDPYGLLREMATTRVAV